MALRCKVHGKFYKLYIRQIAVLAGSIPDSATKNLSQISEVLKHDAHNVESQVRFLNLQPILLTKSFIGYNL